MGWGSASRAACRAWRGSSRTRDVVGRELAVGGAGEGALVGPVELVADDGRAERREVQADLVLPSRLERRSGRARRRARGARARTSTTSNTVAA